MRNGRPHTLPNLLVFSENGRRINFRCFFTKNIAKVLQYTNTSEKYRKR